ncbi:unnamed protein product [Caenorhabditis nigoni]
MSTIRILLLILISYGFSILLASEACAIPNPQQDPVKLGDVPVGGADVVILKNNSTTNETKTPPVSNSVEQGTPEENSNYRYQPITIFSAIFTLILCKII